MAKIAKKIKSIHKNTWVLLAIILVGIFFRAYNFHDWLRFSMDQSRDAMIINDIVEGKSEFPLLGPLAGGTNFHLGPAYYYFSYLTAKIFGNYPDKIAYPSLLFSILAIPLLYLYLKEYFSGKISLILTAIMSVSYFAAINSRFSSNPNLTPFFVLLFIFSFLKLVGNKNKNSFWWAVLAGLSLGIGIQLHTTLLVIMPVCALIFFIYLFKINRPNYLKYAAIVFLVFLTVNATQIISEINTGGNNTRQFFDGFLEKSGKKNNPTKNVAAVLLCQFKANANIISSLPETDNCSKGIDFNIKTGSKELFGDIENRLLRKIAYVLNISFVFIFSLTGYFFAGYYLKRETEIKKRVFLGIFFIFNIVSFIFLIPVANYLYINYFIILFFVPFVILGLWLKFLEEKFPIKSNQIALFLAVFLIALSLWSDKKAASFHARGFNNNLENTDLREIEAVSNFILENNISSAKTIYLSGEKKYLERYWRSLDYMISKKEKALIVFDASQLNNESGRVEYLFYIKNRGIENVENNKPINGYKTIKSRRFYAVDISILKSNVE